MEVCCIYRVFSDLQIELVKTYWQITCTVIGKESLCAEDSTVSLVEWKYLQTRMDVLYENLHVKSFF